MQAILTKYLCPTNHRGARIAASCMAARIVVPYDDGMGLDHNHETAARLLMQQLGWDKNRRPASGTLPNGDFCHVMVPKP